MSDTWQACLDLEEAAAAWERQQGGADWFQPDLADVQLAAIYRWLAATEHGIDPSEVVEDQTHAIFVELAEPISYDYSVTGYDARDALDRRLASHGVTRADIDPISLTWDTIWGATRLWGSTIRDSNTDR